MIAAEAMTQESTEPFTLSRLLIPDALKGHKERPRGHYEPFKRDFAAEVRWDEAGGSIVP
jgi:hypothetical protein